jgi:hypothetical protein
MKKYLVVAHYDGDRTPLKNFVSRLEKKEPSEFHIVVPATPAPTHTLTWTAEESYQVAKQRLDAIAGDLKSVGANVTGEVLNESTISALEEALKKDPYDELIIATPPDNVARTEFSEFEHRVRLFNKTVPIEHIVVEGAKPVERA